jgi:hypothetical protein
MATGIQIYSPSRCCNDRLGRTDAVTPVYFSHHEQLAAEIHPNSLICTQIKNNRQLEEHG